MALFRYKALSATGEALDGQMEAATPDEVIVRLQDQGYLPVEARRAEEGGSGLGLTLAQTFVQQHMGVIECESRPGLTDFRILLPLP